MVNLPATTITKDDITYAESTRLVKSNNSETETPLALSTATDVSETVTSFTTTNVAYPADTASTIKASDSPPGHVYLGLVDRELANCFTQKFQRYGSDKLNEPETIHLLNGSSGTIEARVQARTNFSKTRIFGIPIYPGLGSGDNCYVQVTVPENQTVGVIVQETALNPWYTKLVYVYDFRLAEANGDTKYQFIPLILRRVFLGMSSTVVIRLTFGYENDFYVKIGFSALENNYLQIRQTHELAGFVETPFYTGNEYGSLMISIFVRHFARLVVPAGHVVMTSSSGRRYGGCVSISRFSHVTNVTDTSTYCDRLTPLPAVYNASILTVTLFLQNVTHCLMYNKSDNCVREQIIFDEVDSGLKLVYSYHRHEKSPAQLSNKWNCSVPHWPDFQHHLLCNFITECQESQDEADCPYTTSQCGPGSFPAGDGCFFVARVRPKVSKGETTPTVYYVDGVNACHEEGGQMASLKTRDRYQALEVLTNASLPADRVFFGLTSVPPTLPLWYHALYQWKDGTVDFRNLFWSTKSTENIHDKNCGFVSIVNSVYPSYKVLFASCSWSLPSVDWLVLCEHVIKHKTNTIIFPVLSSDRWYSSKYFSCPARHVTHNFLACDVKTSCWSRERQQCTAPLTPLPPSYTCQKIMESVPYSLVCDTRPDCADGSDEEFCQYPHCKRGYFDCGNGQCVQQNQQCDRWSDCFNGWDEVTLLCRWGHFSQGVMLPPAIVTIHDEYGEFYYSELDTKISTTCPLETHFQCPDNGYCLPVFLRCNGILDCPFHEDEADCASFTCPGFFRCRDSKVCLHPSNVCDGHAHCPQHDDELLCDLVCPDGCVCYGWAFYCSTRFPVSQYSELRYLDVHRTTWTLVDLKELPLMVFLNLSWCNLSSLGDVRHTYANLLAVDLSHNLLTSVHESVLTRMPQLRELILSGNPLHSLFDDVISQLTSLLTLDLSHTPITHIDTRNLSDVIPNLRTLNLSHSGLTRLSDEGFQPLQQLRVVDLRGCPVTHFSVTVFQGLDKLEAVYADNFKMCCPALLPEGFNIRQCHAPVDELSSCEDLLGSAMYTACVFVFCLLSVVGNLTSFVYRSFFNKSKSKMGFGVLVTHLSVADLVMGVYLAIIGCTDRLYNGIYLWHDHSWRHSSTCSLAGFLSLLSSEVSSLIICLITLDRFLVLRFPFSHFHFGSTSAHVAVGMVWVLGLILASVPLMVPHWEFYSQTGICVPLPITRNDFPGRVYSFSIIIVFNFVLFLFISLGQVVIYWSVRVNAMSAANSTKKNKELTIARRLVTLVMSNFLCWFPIGLLGLLASRGVPISRETNVGMAVFVLPLNSALNPFLYTVNVIMERRKRARDEKLKRLITSQLQMPKPLNSSVSENTTCRELV